MLHTYRTRTARTSNSSDCRRSIRASVISLALALCATAALAELPPDYKSLPSDFFEDDFWGEVADLSGETQAELHLERPTLIYLAAEEGTDLHFSSEGDAMIYARDPQASGQWWLQNASFLLAATGTGLELAILPAPGGLALTFNSGGITSPCRVPFSHESTSIATRTGPYGSAAAARAEAISAAQDYIDGIKQVALSSLRCPSFECPVKKVHSAGGQILGSGGHWAWFLSFFQGQTLYHGWADYSVHYKVSCEPRDDQIDA